MTFDFKILEKQREKDQKATVWGLGTAAKKGWRQAPKYSHIASLSFLSETLISRWTQLEDYIFSLRHGSCHVTELCSTKQKLLGSSQIGAEWHTWNMSSLFFKNPPSCYLENGQVDWILGCHPGPGGDSGDWSQTPGGWDRMTEKVTEKTQALSIHATDNHYLEFRLQRIYFSLFFF